MIDYAGLLRRNDSRNCKAPALALPNSYTKKAPPKGRLTKASTGLPPALAPARQRAGACLGYLAACRPSKRLAT